MKFPEVPKIVQNNVIYLSIQSLSNVINFIPLITLEHVE